MNGVLTGISAIVAAVGVVFAARTFAFNGRVNRARFLYDLHRDFFVNETYSYAKKLIDEPSNLDKLRQAIADETDELIGFLNFFELVAYYSRRNVLRQEDVDALLGYYLDRLCRHAEVVKYVKSQQTSFEHLSWLLGKRERR